MTISVFAAAKALNDQLISASGLPPIAGEGYTPNGNAYLLAHTLPGTSFPLTLNTYDQQRSIFQIDVRTPKSEGRWQNRLIADLTAAVFPRGGRYQHNGQEVTTSAVTISAIQEDGAYFFSAVSVPYAVFG